MKANQILPISQTLRKIGPAVAYYPNIAIALKSVNAAIFLCQFMYWEGKQNDTDGWIYKTMDEITKETGLSRYEQESARRRLKELGILEEKRMGIPARLYFKFNWDALDKILSEFEPENEPENETDEHNNEFNEGNDDANKFVENQQTRMLKTSKLDAGKPANYIHKITTEDYIHKNTYNNSIITENESLLTQTEKTEETSLNENKESKEEFKPYWTQDLNHKADSLLKTTTWRRYPHPTRQGITTTIRQMIMDIVCINRLRRELFPSEEEVCIKIQRSLDEGVLTYEKFAEVYREWEKSNVPRIGWLYTALFEDKQKLRPTPEQEQQARLKKPQQIGSVVERCPKCDYVLWNGKCLKCDYQKTK